jgi:hypothetical protein
MKNIKNISFDFIADYSIDDDSISSLTDNQKAQLQTCMILNNYKDFVNDDFDIENIEHLFSEELGGWAFASLYHIVNEDTKEIMFDFWSYNEEDGIIFVHNTANHIGIFMTQFNFELAVENEFNKDLPLNFTQLLQDVY